MDDQLATKGRISERSGLPSALVFILAPFLICGCILLMEVILVGVVSSFALVGLSGWAVLLVWGIGLGAALPLGFMIAVRVGRILLGRGPGGRNV